MLFKYTRMLIPATWRSFTSHCQLYKPLRAILLMSSGVEPPV